MSIYTDIVAAGAAVDSHESDLYCQDTPAVLAVLKMHGVTGCRWGRFICQAGPHKGEKWIDIPFAFDPYWESRSSASRRVRT